jgi:DNA end-binding protein Ku
MERKHIFWASKHSNSGFFLLRKKRDYTSFNQLCENRHKIRYKKWCPVEEREVSWSEIKKGFEITKNSYVILEKEEIDKIMLKTTNTIEIKEFIEAQDFDPIFVKKTTTWSLTRERRK